MKKNLAFLCLILAFAANTHAQTFMSIGKSEGFELFVPKGDENVRVGNAVLVRILAMDAKSILSFSWLVLAACDGSWVSDPIQNNLKPGSVTVKEIYSYSKKTDESLPLTAVFFNPTNQADLIFAKPISRVVTSLCKTAGKEPRNLFIPVVTATVDKDNSGSSTAIVLGTSIRDNNTVDLWTRSTKFKLAPVLDSDGKPYENEGKVQMIKEATGTYTMERRVVNCKDRTMAIYERVEYSEKNAEAKSTSVPRQQLLLKAVVPGSIGEGNLDAVCSLYGPK